MIAVLNRVLLTWQLMLAAMLYVHLRLHNQALCTDGCCTVILASLTAAGCPVYLVPLRSIYLYAILG